MKKDYGKLIATILITSVLIILLFAGFYYFLSTSYTEKKNAESLQLRNQAIATSIDIKVKDDYKKIDDYIKTVKQATDEETLVSLDLANVKDLIGYESDIKTGYYISEDGKVSIYLDKLYTLSDQAKYYQYFDKNAAIYSFDVLNSTISNETNLVYRFENILIYFNFEEYFANALNLVKDDELADQIIFEYTGNIDYSRVTGNKGSLYIDHLEKSNFGLDYDKISELLINNEEGYKVVKYDQTKSYFVFTPILSSFDQNLFLGTAYDYLNIGNSNKYLVNVLLILSCAVVVILIVSIVVFYINSYRKNQDLSANFHLSYYFVKPFVIKVDKRGKILRSNISCERVIKDFDSYKSIKEFKLYKQYEEIMSIVKKQNSFIAEVKSAIENNALYIQFIPMRLFNKYTLIGNDVTLNLKEQMINAKFAAYNQITNLPNKNMFDRTTHDLLRLPGFKQMNVSFVAIDIADFSKINKLYGYESANNMLREIAGAIDGLASANFTEFEIFNIRTSFFIVMFKNVMNYNLIINWCREVVDRLSEPVKIKEDYLIQVEPKIGLLNLTDDIKQTLRSQDIYDFVTTSLEKAKNSRLTKVAMYNSELSVLLSRDQVMEEDLRLAIQNDEFEMFYQPQFSTSEHKIVGFESLLRWNNPKYKFESPEHYVKIAEKNGMIIELGRLINKKVFSFAKSIEDMNITLSLNVSPAQLLQSGFIYELLKAFEEYELKPGSVALEITETFLMENMDVMISKLRILRDKGFSIHLDDFGMGYSSMFYLKDLPVNAIKIDKEFTKYMVNDKTTRVIVTKIVQLGDALELELIAEGVETDKQKDLLSHMGCHIIQGYLISKPINYDDVLKLIEKYNGKVIIKEFVKTEKETKAVINEEVEVEVINKEVENEQDNTNDIFNEVIDVEAHKAEMEKANLENAETENNTTDSNSDKGGNE